MTAQECDSGVTTATVASRCDGATVITGKVGTNGKVAFTPTGVTIKTGTAYSEAGPGSVPKGGAAAIVVTDTTSPAVSVTVPITVAP